MRQAQQTPMEQLIAKIDEFSKDTERRMHRLEDKMQETEEELVTLIHSEGRYSYNRDHNILAKLDRLPEVESKCRKVLELLKGWQVTRSYFPSLEADRFHVKMLT